MKNSLFTKKRIRFSLFIIYLLITVYFAISYWFISSKPIIAPVFAKLDSYLGDIKELPLGEEWTNRYTLRVTSSNGVGLVGKNCVVFLPFAINKEQQEIEISIRSVLICPGYQTKMTVLFNNDNLLEQFISYDWQEFRFAIPTSPALLPAVLRLRFDMLQKTKIPEYDNDYIIAAYPDEKGIRVWNTQEWLLQIEDLDSGDISVRRNDNTISINSNQYRIGDLPVTVALTRWNSLLLSSYPLDLPFAACRKIGIIYESE